MKESIANNTKAIEHDPNNAEAYFERAVARNIKGDKKGAIADFIKVLEIQPDNDDALN